MDDPTRALTVGASSEQDAPPRNPAIPPDADDARVVQIWLDLHESAETREAYADDIAALLVCTNGKPFAALSLPDLQNFQKALIAARLAPATRARRLYAVKSLLSFCQRAGYIRYNVGAALKPGRVPEKLAERIMSEAAVMAMFTLEKHPRNHAILRLLYYTGIRVSELCAVRWRDVQAAHEQGGGQVYIWGKGQKERYIALPAKTGLYAELEALRPLTLAADDPAPVFPGDKPGEGLSRSQVFRIVSEAAIRADIATYTTTGKDGQPVKRSRVSPHWLRHAHGSHSLDRGAPVHLVRDTLGHSNIATTNKYSHAKPGESSGGFLPM